jgi:hypothetical protein
MTPETKLKKPGANDLCPCGSTREDGKPYKFKHCCGSPKGDLVYFVSFGEEALTNADGRVLIFNDTAIAFHVARREGWTEGDIIPMAPHRFAKFKEAIPYVTVVTKDFEVDKKPDDKPQLKTFATTTLTHLMSDAITPEKSDEA